MARERGSVTLVALGLSVFVLLAGVAAVDVGLLAATRVRVQTAADLAALAALTPAAGGAAAGSAAAGPVGAGAAGASLLAGANGAELRGCDCSTWQAVVTVRRRVVLPPLGLPVVLVARARAVLTGPDPSPGRPQPRTNVAQSRSAAQRRRAWAAARARRAASSAWSATGKASTARPARLNDQVRSPTTGTPVRSARAISDSVP
jgi:hypothetical protein